MLDTIQDFFQRALAGSGEDAPAPPSLELAIAALLFEVARADYRLDDDELRLLRTQLERHFTLDAAALDELVELAQAEADQAVDHYRFVRLIKQHYGYPARCELVAMMWSLALADGEAHYLEEHRIRRLAELLHVGHGDFIRAKLQAQKEAGGGASRCGDEASGC